MTEYELYGSHNAVALNALNTVGVMAVDGIPTNETRRMLVNPSLLEEWAAAVAAAYGEDVAVELVFTPDKPLIAVSHQPDEESRIGIGVSPRVIPGDDDDDC